MKKWTQSDLKFCKNEGLKRIKNYKKRESTRSKTKEKIGTKCFKILKAQVFVKHYTNFRSNYLELHAMETVFSAKRAKTLQSALLTHIDDTRRYEEAYGWLVVSPGCVHTAWL